MISTKEIENLSLRKSDDLCKLAELFGKFLDDNPGAMEAIRTWILENQDLLEEDRVMNNMNKCCCGCDRVEHTSTGEFDGEKYNDGCNQCPCTGYVCGKCLSKVTEKALFSSTYTSCNCEA